MSSTVSNRTPIGPDEIKSYCLKSFCALEEIENQVNSYIEECKDSKIPLNSYSAGEITNQLIRIETVYNNHIGEVNECLKCILDDGEQGGKIPFETASQYAQLGPLLESLAFKFRKTLQTANKMDAICHKFDNFELPQFTCKPFENRRVTATEYHFPLSYCMDLKKYTTWSSTTRILDMYEPSAKENIGSISTPSSAKPKLFYLSKEDVSDSSKILEFYTKSFVILDDMEASMNDRPQGGDGFGNGWTLNEIELNLGDIANVYNRYVELINNRVDEKEDGNHSELEHIKSLGLSSKSLQSKIEKTHQNVARFDSYLSKYEFGKVNFKYPEMGPNPFIQFQLVKSATVSRESDALSSEHFIILKELPPSHVLGASLTGEPMEPMIFKKIGTTAWSCSNSPENMKGKYVILDDDRNLIWEEKGGDHPINASNPPAFDEEATAPRVPTRREDSVLEDNVDKPSTNIEKDNNSSITAEEPSSSVSTEELQDSSPDSPLFFTIQMELPPSQRLSACIAPYWAEEPLYFDHDGSTWFCRLPSNAMGKFVIVDDNTKEIKWEPGKDHSFKDHPAPNF